MTHYLAFYSIDMKPINKFFYLHAYYLTSKYEDDFLYKGELKIWNRITILTWCVSECDI